MRKTNVKNNKVSDELKSAINYLNSNSVAIDENFNSDIKLKAIKEEDEIIGQDADLSKISFGDGKKLDVSKLK